MLAPELLITFQPVCIVLYRICFSVTLTTIERKVAILNGAHTALVPVAFQAGLDTVGEAMNDAEICAFVEKAIYEEIIPVLDLPR
ncbi:TPA: hypothetical protein OO334_004307, partial [Shigella flexneri]|nr:hypothetical protein [Shigella flexneri]